MSKQNKLSIKSIKINKELKGGFTPVPVLDELINQYGVGGYNSAFDIVGPSIDANITGIQTEFNDINSVVQSLETQISNIVTNDTTSTSSSQAFSASAVKSLLSAIHLGDWDAAAASAGSNTLPSIAGHNVGDDYNVSTTGTVGGTTYYKGDSLVLYFDAISGRNAWKHLLGGLALSTINTNITTVQTNLDNFEATAAQPSGLATLDPSGKVPISQIPDSLLGSLNYKGALDASTGAYPVDPSKGDYYVITVAGTIDGTSYEIHDWAVYNGTSWDKVISSATDLITSVNGEIGDVVLTTDDVEQGLDNLYYTKEVASGDLLLASIPADPTDITPQMLIQAPTLQALLARIAQTPNDTDAGKIATLNIINLFTRYTYLTISDDFTMTDDVFNIKFINTASDPQNITLPNLSALSTSISGIFYNISVDSSAQSGIIINPISGKTINGNNTPINLAVGAEARIYMEPNGTNYNLKLL